ncbi:hypothetical protein F4823DRAFT_627358 [Ustulina deusta]|nr:hypothetical protein F4823DRAFT_627358 [Ustulina deusta]
MKFRFLRYLKTTHIAQRKYDPGRDIDQESISSVSDSDYSTENENESQRRKMPKARLFVRQIGDQIQSLQEISSLLRRPTVRNKFIRSTNAAGLEANPLRGVDNLHLNDAFRLFDDNHVLEKVLQWRGLSKSQLGFTFSNENAAAGSDAPSHQEIKDIHWFCQRLARANTRRREQLRYWKSHPYDAAQSVTSANLAGNVSIMPKEDSRSQESTIKPLDPVILPGGPKLKAASSKQSFSTVAFSDPHDTETSIRPRTIYAPTVMG